MTGGAGISLLLCKRFIVTLYFTQVIGSSWSGAKKGGKYGGLETSEHTLRPMSKKMNIKEHGSKRIGKSR